MRGYGALIAIKRLVTITSGKIRHRASPGPRFTQGSMLCTAGKQSCILVSSSQKSDRLSWGVVDRLSELAKLLAAPDSADRGTLTASGTGSASRLASGIRPRLGGSTARKRSLNSAPPTRHIASINNRGFLRGTSLWRVGRRTCPPCRTAFTNPGTLTIWFNN
jgi:hypothetical protein